MESKSGKVEIPVPVQYAACDYVHTMFHDAEGNVWSTGENNRGQLGHGDNLTISVDILWDESTFGCVDVEIWR